MTKTTESARGESCTARIPGVCNWNPETTVFAHAPSEGSGMAIKSKVADGADWGAYACSDCHDALDGRTHRLHADDKARFWLDAIFRTQRKLFEKGLWQC